MTLGVPIEHSIGTLFLLGDHVKTGAFRSLCGAELPWYAG